MSGLDSEAEPSRGHYMLRALSHRNYRLFFAGQSVSLIGTWITRLATGWLVYRLTASPLLLGLVGFVGQLPMFVLGPFAGVLVDRWPRRRTLLVTQALAMAQSLAMAGLALAGIITVWHVMALSLLQGIINAFDMPARQVFVVEMIEARRDLPNAIALNSLMVNGARLVGPSIAGGLIAAVGEGGCFLVDGLSYVAVIASLWAMRVAPSVPRPRGTAVLAEARAGVRYALGFPPIRDLLLLVALVSLMGMPYTVLMPAVATHELHGGPRTLGLLMGAAGLGALAGATFLASRRSVVGLGRVVVLAVIAAGVGLLAFAAAHSLAPALALLLVVGLGLMVMLAASNTILQTIVDEDKRGRVMGLYGMAVMGTAPFGSLLAGLLAARIGAMATLAVGGGVCVLSALYFARRLPTLRQLVRPIYERLGIVPEIAAGLHSTEPRLSPQDE